MILVTGGTGFIGSHLADRLAALGRPVRCLVRRRGGLPDAIQVAQGDLATGAGLQQALRGVDTIIHLAGVTKARNPADFDRGNRLATENLLAAAADVARIVHVSSLAAAGPSHAAALTEADEPRPISQYGRSKLAGEEAVRHSHLRDRTVIIRPPVVYGPRDRDVYQIFRTAARGWMAQIGTTPRQFSYIYVGDLVDGLIAAADSAHAGGRTYYVANPTPASWSEFGGLAAQLMARHLRTVAIPEKAAYFLGMSGEWWTRLSGKPGILSRDKVREACADGWVCDPGLACRELGFRASTTLADGLRRTLAWYREAGWLTF